MRPWKSTLFPWNWRKVRAAQITQADRDLFERYGENVIGTVLTGNVSPQAPDLRSILTTYIAVPGQGQVIGNKFTEARDWLTECRDADERREQRAETIEVGVVALIGLEIVLSLYGISEGNKQAAILDDMKRSTASTAAAMTDVKTNLEALAIEQKKSTGQLQQMNDSLQTSAVALRSQLQILKQEQADTIALRSRKPSIVLTAGGRTASPGHLLEVVTENPTDTSGTLTLLATNSGTAAAHGLIIRLVIFDETVSVDGVNMNVTHVPTPLGNMASVSVFTIEIGRLIPRATQIMPLTLHFPPGHSTFHIRVSRRRGA